MIYLLSALYAPFFSSIEVFERTVHNFAMNGFACVDGIRKYEQIPPGVAVFDVRAGYLQIYFREHSGDLFRAFAKINDDELSEEQKTAGVVYGQDGEGYQQIVCCFTTERLDIKYLPEFTYLEKDKEHLFKVTVTNDGYSETRVYDLVDVPIDDPVDVPVDKRVSFAEHNEVVNIPDESGEDESGEEHRLRVILIILDRVVPNPAMSDAQKEHLKDGVEANILGCDDVGEICQELNEFLRDVDPFGIVSKVYREYNVSIEFQDDFDGHTPVSEMVELALAKVMEEQRALEKPTGFTIYNKNPDASKYDPMFLGEDGYPTPFFIEFMTFALRKFVKTSPLLQQVLHGKLDLGKALYLFLTSCNSPEYMKILMDNKVFTYICMQDDIADELFGANTPPMRAVRYMGRTLEDLFEASGEDYSDPASIMTIRFYYYAKEMVKTLCQEKQRERKKARRPGIYQGIPSEEISLEAFTVKGGGRGRR